MKSQSSFLPKRSYTPSGRYKGFSIYLDLDGVMADYEAGIENMGFTVDRSLNRSSTLLPGSGSAKKREMHEAIKGTTFYANLPMLPGAARLYNEVFEAYPIILTAAPKFGATEEDFMNSPYWQGAMFHKRNWVETVLLPRAAELRMSFWDNMFRSAAERYHLPDYRFICTSSARKHEYMHRTHSDHQILIDDRSDNIASWIAAGGIGILHTNVDDTIAQLHKIAPLPAGSVVPSAQPNIPMPGVENPVRGPHQYPA
jgi:hypothetical protein